MRTDLHFKLICSECGELLECKADDIRNRMSFHSVKNANVVMIIKPCQTCHEKITKPIKALRVALKSIQEDNE